MEAKAPLPDEVAVQPAQHVEAAEDGGDHALKQAANAIIEGDTALAIFTRYEAIKFFWWPVLLCMVSTVACMNDGFQNQIPGNLISNQGFINQFGTVYADDGSKALAPSWISTWGAMMPLGQVPGSLFAGWVNDKVGRRGGMYAFTVAYIVYISEIAPPQLRGTMLCMYGFFLGIGQLTGAVVLYVINNQRPLEWRLAIYTEWAFHGLWISLGLLWLPESPWYYARKQNDDKALKSLGTIYKFVADWDSHRELRVMKSELHRQAQQAASHENDSSIMDLFRGPDRLRTFGSALAVSTQMLSGCIVIFTYTSYFIRQAGIGQPFQASMIVSCLLLVGLIISFFAVELLGRRVLIIGGGIGCTICNLVIGITGCFHQTPTLNHTALAFVFLFVLSYAMSFAGVCWAMVSEVSSARLKAKSAAFAMLMFDLTLLVFTVSVPFMLASSGPGARNWGTRSLFCFAITCGLATLGNYFLYPETKGRTQQEIDEIYEKGIPPRKSSKYVSSLEVAGGKAHHD